MEDFDIPLSYISWEENYNIFGRRKERIRESNYGLNWVMTLMKFNFHAKEECSSMMKF